MVALPDQPAAFPQYHQVAYVCDACHLKNKYVQEKRPVPFAIYYEQIDASGQLDWKNCAMCGDRAYGTTAWCWRCAAAMQHPSAQERLMKTMIEKHREWLQREMPAYLQWAENRLGVNSVGALQVLPDSAADYRPSAALSFEANPSLPPSHYEWSQALDVIKFT